MTSPTRSEVVQLPPEYRAATGVLQVRHEEEAVCWLWAYPSLLPWDRPVTWLYTPVVGRHRWPGDLWGVDDHGDLMIIECKQSRGAVDPFGDFVGFHADGRCELSAAHWAAKFPKHLRAELAFGDGIRERPPGRTDGILPRSNKRAPLRRWPDLARRIDMRIRSAAYLPVVLEHLETRERAGNPRPYYWGLIVACDSSSYDPSPETRSSAQTLRGQVGNEHVLLATVCGQVSGGGQVRVTAGSAWLPNVL